MPDASYIRMDMLRALLEALGRTEGEYAEKLKNHMVDCWVNAPGTPRCVYENVLNEFSAGPSHKIGMFLERIFLNSGRLGVYWGTTPGLLAIHDGLEKIWDAWNGLEMRDTPEEILKDMFSTIRMMGATSADVKRVREQLEKHAARPMSVFRSEIQRLQTLRTRNAEEEGVEEPGSERTAEEG